MAGHEIAFFSICSTWVAIFVDKNLIAHFNCAHLFQFWDATDYERMISKYKIRNVQTQVYSPKMYEKLNPVRPDVKS